MGACSSGTKEKNINKENNNNNNNNPLPKLIIPPDFNMVKRVLKEINEYRKTHELDKLTPSIKLCESAQNHSDYLAKNNILEKSKYKRESISVQDIKSDKINAVSTWYNTKKHYNKEKENIEDNKEAMDYINMIWKFTNEFGVGISKNDDKIYIVGHYAPEENLNGDFKDNMK